MNVSKILLPSYYKFETIYVYCIYKINFEKINEKLINEMLNTIFFFFF